MTPRPAARPGPLEEVATECEALGVRTLCVPVCTRARNQG
jgi:hypothetical protein